MLDPHLAGSILYFANFSVSVQCLLARYIFVNHSCFVNLLSFFLCLISLLPCLACLFVCLLAFSSCSLTQGLYVLSTCVAFFVGLQVGFFRCDNTSSDNTFVLEKEKHSLVDPKVSNLQLGTEDPNLKIMVNTYLQEYRDNNARISFENTMLSFGRFFNGFIGLFQVIGGELYITQNTPSDLVWQTFIRSRRFSVASLVMRVIEQWKATHQEPFPDVEFVVSFFDEDGAWPWDGLCANNVTINIRPNFADEGRYLTPIFSWAPCRSKRIPFSDIGIPSYDETMSKFEEFDEKSKAIAENAQLHSWESRSDKAVFRGGLRTCYLADDDGDIVRFQMRDVHKSNTWGECGRGRLMYACGGGDMQKPFNASHVCVDSGHCDADITDRLQQAMVKNNCAHNRRMNSTDFEKFKYVMSPEGQGQWANRVRLLAFGGSAIIKQAVVCKEYFESLMIPGVHYIPVDYHFNNLTAAIDWARSHDAEVQQMVKRMQELARDYLSTSAALRYFSLVLREYGALLSYKPKILPGFNAEAGRGYRFSSLEQLLGSTVADVKHPDDPHVFDYVNPIIENYRSYPNWHPSCTWSLPNMTYPCNEQLCKSHLPKSLQFRAEHKDKPLRNLTLAACCS